MAALQLRASTGKPQVDRILGEVVALIEARWPDRVRGYYLVGSYAVGEDIRPRVPRKPVERHIRDLMHSMVPLLARVRGDPPSLSYPLDYPDANGWLRGYDRRYRDLPADQRTATKDLGGSEGFAPPNLLTTPQVR